MKYAVQIFIKQTRRGTKRLVLQLVLLCAVTAFFVVSLNLYSNSMKNLQSVENAYTTIATAEFYGYVTEDGKLVYPGDEACVGEHLLSVEGFDLSSLRDLDSVKSIDLRTRVGAYIPGQVFVRSMKDFVPSNVYDVPEEWLGLIETGNVIRFTLDSDQPVNIPLDSNAAPHCSLPIRIIETSNPLLSYPDIFSISVTNFDDADAEEIRRLNRSDYTDSIILYPDVEYVMAVSGGTVWIKDPETGVYTWQTDDPPYQALSNPHSGIGLRLSGFDYGKQYQASYSKNSGYSVRLPYSGEKTGPFPLQRYEDVKDDPTWAEYTQAAEYDAHAFNVTLTEDITLLPAWNQGAMYLNDGRLITEEEYKSGAKVCMVSAQMAAYQGWQMGDKLEMHLYACDGFFDRTSVKTDHWLAEQNYLRTPTYLSGCGGFFEEGTYEIVGIFGQQEFTDFGDTAEEVFYSPWNAIYIPANSAPNAPEGPIQPSLITIELKNGSLNEFKAAVEEMGLTDFQVGEYELKFSYFDQGYDKIKDGLDEMNRNAVLLLGLSSALLLVTMVLMAFLFAQQHKHSAGILRMLGGSKKQTFTAILTCAAAVVLIGDTVGTVLGGALTQSVGASILGDVGSTAVKLETGANIGLTALTGMGCVVLFLLLTAIFTAAYIGKEPRTLLPQDKG